MTSAWRTPALSRGWLVAFAVWSCVPVGSMVLLLIHSLTGGRWGEATTAILRPSAALTSVVAIVFIPILVSYGQLYPWAQAGSPVAQDVIKWYLNWPAYVSRALLALCGWWVLGTTFALGRGRPLLAGLGLAFYGATISLVAFDWYLSVEPRYVATAFPATLAIQQLAATLAFVAVFAAPSLDESVASDIGALLLATLLGVVYLEFMTYLVAWYGDLPDKAAWYLKRSSSAWAATIIVAFVFGAVLPFCILLLRKGRRSRYGLQSAGISVLLGSVLHFCWLIVPAFDHQVLVAAAAASAFVVLSVGSILVGRVLIPEAGHVRS
ncbi:hypothetical protein XH80_15660 [Bradyrhizobium sp. CCBAU 45384]|nr:hypothetical protein [Bradyrhizobium sp. CCBAU 45384]